MSRILVLGGTRFVGRAIVEQALVSGHRITLFNRGLTDAGLFSNEAEIITGDRRNEQDVTQLEAASWDAVIDVSAYTPSDLHAVLPALERRTARYCYISTISVYRSDIAAGADELAPTIEVEPSIARTDPLAYGGLKALCERQLAERFTGRLTVVRPTVVIGPRDPTDRFGWWVRHVAPGGNVTVPPRVDQHVQLIDSRDLAAFVVSVVERGVDGAFNAAGPLQPLTLGAMVDTIAEAAGVTVNQEPGTDDGGFPLTVGAGDSDAVFRVSIKAALEAGLHLRPLTESARDVLSWERTRTGV
ncbi:MAG: NAD-dependent epimerase/dehydratase family protein [Candidatus Dormibacteraeota bacterium]|nr:NAD-dependent epimerase/dehydratase family protein [Candidatus Dormibacteraeota bacterium]